MSNLLGALGLKPPKGGIGTEIPASALVRWHAERTPIVARLRALGERANKSRHVKAAAAYIEIQAVIKNLARDPQTLRQVDELEHWLREDDVVGDVDNLAVPIRAPLLAALASARASVPR